MDSLCHVVAVVADKNGLVDAFRGGNLVDEFGVVSGELHFVADFDVASRDGLRLDGASLRAFLDDLGGSLLGCVILSFGDYDEIGRSGLGLY